MNAPPESAELHLFASTRYRLWVNGSVLGHGPSRYVIGHEHFDTHDIAPHLRLGENRVVVEACFIDANNFQSMPGDRGRFIAWGHVKSQGETSIDLTTPGDWLATRDDARIRDVPTFSFAIGPVEVVDQSRLEASLGDDFQGQTPATLDGEPSLQPRGLAMPSGPFIQPRLVHATPIRPAEHRIGFVSVHPTDRGGTPGATRGQHFRYATFIHSPKPQTVTLGVHWGPHFLNGHEIKGADDPSRGNRQNARAALQEGWNLLCGEPEQLNPAKPLLIGLPLDAQLIIHASPDADDVHAMRFQTAGQRPDENRWINHPPAAADDLALNDPAWQFIPRGTMPPIPARMMSWDTPDTSRRQNNPTLPLRFDEHEAHTLLFDCNEEYLGHVRIDIEAPAGAVVDVAYDERLRGDGGIDLFACNHTIESADRFICREGRQTLETFHPRGGRYIQLTIRHDGAPAPSTPITLHALTIRDARCLTPLVEPLTCGDEVFEWAWRVGARTIQGNIEDVFCDSPWRERGNYLDDSYIHSLVLMDLTEDRRVIQRSLRLFAQGQREDGQLPCVVPAWLRKPHGDFTLIYVLWLRDFWARGGDLDTVRECLPAAERALASATWSASPHSCLWDASEENRLFIDWGALLEARRYDENGVLNALRYRALRDAAELSEALGEAARAEQHRRNADAVKTDFQSLLWMPDAGRFAGGTRDGQPVSREVLHVNILALAFGLASPTQEPALIDYVLQRLRHNAAHAVKGKPADDFAELSFLKHVLDALARIERFDVAEQVIRDHMRVMIDHDAYTFWECLHRGVRDFGSLCHSWSTAPLDYFSRYLLGVREATPGQPDHLHIDPRPHSINHAQGVFPHRRGPVHIHWTRTDDGRFAVSVNAPPSIKITLADTCVLAK